MWRFYYTCLFFAFTSIGCNSVSSGELKKTIEIVIRDDFKPEDSESLMIGLVNTEGGSRILPSSDTVTVVILANDNVAGVVGFHPASHSIIAREGEFGYLFCCEQLKSH